MSSEEVKDLVKAPIPEVLEEFNRFCTVYRKGNGKIRLNQETISGIYYDIEVVSNDKIMVSSFFTDEKLIFDTELFREHIKAKIISRLNVVKNDLVYNVEHAGWSSTIIKKVTVDSEVNDAYDRGMYSLKITITKYKKRVLWFKKFISECSFIIGYGKTEIFITPVNDDYTEGKLFAIDTNHSTVHHTIQSLLEIIENNHE